MKATSLLEKQHRKLEAIFKKLESGRGDAPALLRELADDLAAHMAIEQGFDALVPKNMSSTSADAANRPAPKKNGRGQSTSLRV
jgi:hypothetical protein